MIGDLSSHAPLIVIVLGGCFGAIVGSFMATIALRWPQQQRVSHGRSRCDNCGQVLRFWELVPILSWLLLRGRCSRCGAAIAPSHLAIELTAAAIGAAAVAIAPNLGGVMLALLGWQLLLLGWLDARHMWLPHLLSGLLAVSGLTGGGLAMAGLAIDASAPDRVIGLLVGYGGLALVALAYRAIRGRDGLGGGDAPMLGAIGAWTGWAVLPLILLLAAVAGLATALVRGLRRSGDEHLQWQNMRLPLGTLLALATPCALLVMQRI